ncbi:5-hydroxytryptamine receptor 3A-like [Genypterus blacodes]|uniref:5-hydroxytryptamine receptor 3A-like n=1 Tax=Genypterus blacodes TaxID=154954 RepID=UPI003F763191
MLHCSRPEPPALLEALQPAFSLSSIRPSMDMSATKVNISFIMYGILDVDEKAQILTTYVWMQLDWDNHFIIWHADECGAERISVPRKKLWVPDVVINEVVDKNSAPYVPYVYLFSDGTVSDAHPFRVVSSCNLNIYTFPFDIQICYLTFNSYLHRKSDLELNLQVPVEEIVNRSKNVMATNGEWQLVNITAAKAELNASDGQPYDELRFFVTVKRRPTLYVVNLLLPSCFLITVDLFSFLLPPQNVDRSSFKMTLILGYTVFLLIMNDLLPVTGNTIPLINVFFCLCLALMVASLLETLLVTNLLCGSACVSPVPWLVRVIFLQILGCLVCHPPKPRDRKDTVIQNSAVHEMRESPLAVEKREADKNPPEGRGSLLEHKALEELKWLGKDLQTIRHHMDQQLTVSQSSEDWMQVGFIIDRLLFGLYILFITVSFITIVCLWVQSYNM